MRRLSVFCFIVFMSSLVGCNKEQETTTQAAREPVPTMSNSDLQKQIESRINSDADLKAADLSVEADANRNHATLSGTVESDELRDRAVELARSAHPGLALENRIEVKPRELSRSEYTEEHARQERETAKENKETIGESPFLLDVRKQKWTLCPFQVFCRATQRLLLPQHPLPQLTHLRDPFGHRSQRERLRRSEKRH